MGETSVRTVAREACGGKEAIGEFPAGGRAGYSARMVKVLALCLLLSMPLPVPRAERTMLYSVDISTATAAEVEMLRDSRGVRWWVELGDALVVEAEAGWESTTGRFEARALPKPGPGEQLYLGRRLHANDLDEVTWARLLVSSGTLSVVAARPMSLWQTGSDEHFALSPLEPNRMYASAARPDAASRAKSASLAAAAAAIDADRWVRTVDDLVEFRTRLTGTAGAQGARDYIAAQFEALGLRVQLQAFQVNGRDAWNVVGELAGTTRPDDIYVVGAHYDSTSERASDLAPGAEDNASGTAGVIEIARAIVATGPAASIRFVAFSGEEQGLHGSTEFVRRLESAGEAGRVRGVITMDMISFTRDEDLDVLLEAGANGEALVNTLAASAAAVTRLRVVTSFNPFGSDHVPFIRAGIPALLTIENDWDQYPGYHRSTDTTSYVDVDMGSEVLKMNASALAVLAGANGDAPAITSVRYTSKNAGPRLVVDGRFAWQTSAIEVDGRRLAQTIFREKFRDGDVTRRLLGADPSLPSLVPKRAPVRVRVVNTATGEATPEFVFTRQ